MITHLFDLGPIPRRITGDTQAGRAHASHAHALFLVGLAKAAPHHWLSECF